MARRETPWLKPAYLDVYMGPSGWEWLCGAVVHQLFNVPKSAQIKVVISDKPVRGAIRVSVEGGVLILKLEEGDQTVLMWGDFLNWLGPGDHWGWIEYEVA